MQCVERKTSSPGVRVFVARDRDAILGEVGRWSRDLRRRDANVLRVGLFGSYATGAYGPGSDLDILVIVRSSGEPRWFMRSSSVDVAALSVGADLFVYTEPEAGQMRRDSAWFRHVLGEMIWLE